MTELAPSSFHPSPERPPQDIFVNYDSQPLLEKGSINCLLKELEYKIEKTDEFLSKPNFSRLESKDFDAISKGNSDLKIVIDSERK
jgi:hypothetical protein